MTYKINYGHNYLAHYGVLGMKWGVRNYQNPDGSLTEAGKKRYSSDQYKRDQAIYGRTGAKRINKHILEGDSVSAARSKEASRINSARRRAQTAGTVGATIGTIGGMIGGYAVSKYVESMLGVSVGSMESMAVKAAVIAGATQAGKELGRYGGRSIAMLASGYSPSKWRYTY